MTVARGSVTPLEHQAEFFADLARRIAALERAAHRHTGPVESAYVATAQATASASYTDLTTVGPSVTARTGTSAVVILTALVNQATTGNSAMMGVAVSGASTIAATDAKAVIAYDPSATNSETVSGAVLITGLTPGDNTFTAKYKANGGTNATFTDRTITVIPL